jgi:hypothetical protein
MCADIVERFQLALMLSVIALRNMIEMAGSDIAFLPKSFIRGKSLVDSILSVCLLQTASTPIPTHSDSAIITLARMRMAVSCVFLKHVRTDHQPVLFVIISEMVVDWLKHAFITKFNHVRASIYGRFTDVLAKDVLLAGSMTRRKKKKGKNVRHF